MLSLESGKLVTITGKSGSDHRKMVGIRKNHMNNLRMKKQDHWKVMPETQHPPAHEARGDGDLSCRWGVRAHGPNCSGNSCVGSDEGSDPIGGTGIFTISLENKEPWTCSVFFGKYVFFSLKRFILLLGPWVMDSSASDRIASNKSLLSDITYFQSLPTIT